MQPRRKKWGFVIVGAVAVLTLGAIAVASAATTQSASPSPSASAQASQTHTPDFDGDGPRGDGDGGRIHNGGPGDIAEALAKLSGEDETTIMTQRASGKSYAEIAKALGVSTDDLLAEATTHRDGRARRGRQGRSDDRRRARAGARGPAGPPQGGADRDEHPAG